MTLAMPSSKLFKKPANLVLVIQEDRRADDASPLHSPALLTVFLNSLKRNCLEVFYAENDSPQPHVLLAFGFTNLKEPPIKSF